MPGLLRKVAERATGNLCQVEGAKLVLLHHLARQGLMGSCYKGLVDPLGGVEILKHTHTNRRYGKAFASEISRSTEPGP